MDDDEIHLRRSSEEVEALLSYYGENDFKRSLKEFNSSSSSSVANVDVASSSASALLAVGGR
ncbi:hypothetical protein ACHAWU_009050 [Discostella pseudostelligera]|uniref:Uncharacterized protein n=1 Tax=Discostella pseudostelligera TaxID=259834 RepID=A0ABD3MCQ6_9STRA